MYNIGEFAKLINRSVNTLQRWDRQGTLKAFRHPSGHRYYTEQQLLEHKGLKASEKSVVIAYCRVSNRSQQDDLKGQRAYIAEFCLHAGLGIDEWYEDIASGLNFKRKQFTQLFTLVEAGQVKKIIVAHKDRLVRFGFEWFEHFCVNHGCEIIVINNEKLSPEQEIIQDLISIIHVFSSRIYGLRKYKKTIKQDIHDHPITQN